MQCGASVTCRVESGVTYLQTYNAENRTSSIAKLATGDCSTPGAYAAKWDFTYDGDGTRTGQSYTPYTNGQPGDVVITRYYFGGAYETHSDGTIKKYYSFAGQTIAMRTWDVGLGTWNLSYFLSDHLGSVSVVLSATGTILEQQRYLPFGQARVMQPYASVISTDFTYTGQRNLPDTGLMDYKARFYSPYIIHFSQPDTIIPDLSNPQSLNRYAYVRNNPIRYNDPTGHKECDDGGNKCKRYTTKDQIKDLKSDIKKRFKWNIKGDGWSLTELQVIYQTGIDIENYVDNLAKGKGNAWMLRNLGNTDFVHASWNDPHAETWPFGGATIYLGKTWLNHPIWKPNETISHELGHVWDINTGFAASADLIQNVGGGEVWYFGKPEKAPQWNPRIHPNNGDAYGNSARNDYFAEAFSLTIYSPGDTPSGVSTWIDANIANPAFADIFTLDPSDPVP